MWILLPRSVSPGISFLYPRHRRLLGVSRWAYHCMSLSLNVFDLLSHQSAKARRYGDWEWPYCSRCPFNEPECSSRVPHGPPCALRAFPISWCLALPKQVSQRIQDIHIRRPRAFDSIFIIKGLQMSFLYLCHLLATTKPRKRNGRSSSFFMERANLSVVRMNPLHLSGVAYLKSLFATRSSSRTRQTR